MDLEAPWGGFGGLGGGFVGLSTNLSVLGLLCFGLPFRSVGPLLVPDLALDVGPFGAILVPFWKLFETEGRCIRHKLKRLKFGTILDCNSRGI